ncbi:hypothetical protein E8E13_000869 [Curvularia kusanoi]|uniref:Uncharacterized protein n=1 Tax=Curvularia kusanoi TaxID=90978 RepID=A0A9P4W1Y4_CURKU|nr:hypothetical protein E8E13_000869 [Curvularia kusanoi]
MPASSRRRDDDTISEASSISSRRSQPGPPRIDTRLSQSGRPRPKFVSFGRDSDVTPNREYINESSPLINPADRARETDRLLKEPIPPALNGQEDDDYFPEFEETKSSFFLFLLTLGGLGLQIGWSVETSNGSPYLLSLGLSKSMLALVWIAGPLSGVLVQPYVGLKSDNCRITWGKRRPFIIGGAIATIASLMLLGWAREIVAGIGKLFGADGENYWVVTITMVFAVLLVYVLDFAINVIQAAIRAYIVDVAPTHQQESANAWLMRSAGVGNIAGYLAGYINLPLYLPWLGDTQFKVLCAIASFIMALTVGISCTAGERDPTRDPPPAEQKEGVLAFFSGLNRSVKRLPDQIKRVCEVQFFAWIGWFPFLFYITTYVGEIYADPFFEANPHMSDAEIDKVWEDATRIGTRALLVFACTTFLCSVIFPFIIPPSFQAPEPEPEPATPGTPARPTTPLTPATPHSMGGSGYFTLRPKRTGPPKTKMEKFSAALDKLQIKSLTLRRSWFISHILFAILMGLTFVIKSTMGATILVGAIGVPWCLTGWAPFSIIASEISKRDAIRRGAIKPTNEEEQAVAEGADAGDADSAGVVLGIHNVAIAAPQVIATLVSSVIFRALQKPRGVAGDDSVAWVLRFGGLCAIIAAWLTLRVHEEKDLDEREEEERPIRRRRLSELSNMTSVLEGQSGR